MYDTALDDFMKQFGPIEPPKIKLAGMSMGSTDTVQGTPKLMGAARNDWQMGSTGTNFQGQPATKAKSGLLSKVGEFAKGFGASGGGQGGFSQRYDYDPELQNQYLAMEGVKDTIAPMLGPVGMAARAAETMGKEIGTAVGGEKGGDIAGGLLDPLSAQLEVLKNDDATGAEKVFGTIAPFLGLAGKARQRTRNRVEREGNLKEVENQRKQNADDYRMSKGLATIADSKELLKKQFNII